ncbi:MAG: beta-ketoacyl-[acyl-carrier-protein] synthase II, partial [Coriobacteriia bacterium]|nr:beta-ketoacyl-[acyl-carrier-protein] synthase II [Coriobacteriia bacterium]
MEAVDLKRVAVTGLGCITPIGNDVQGFWSNLIAGKHGFAPITRFDASGLKVRIAAEVKDFDPTDYIEKAEVKHTDLYAQYAIAAASQAVEESGICGQVAPERLG